jgi:hypothetical protein
MAGLGTALEARLRANDVTQVATLVFAALVVTLVTVWPSAPRSVNESWYAFAQTRGVVLALLALGFGATAAGESARRSVTTGLAVVLIALLTIPLEIAAYAASYPATPLWWSLTSIAVAPGAYFMLGLGLGAAASRLRLGAFLPLLVPGVLIGMLMLDIRLGWTMFNPLTASLHISGSYAAVTGTLAALALVWGWLRWRQGAPAAVTS